MALFDNLQLPALLDRLDAIASHLSHISQSLERAYPPPVIPDGIRKKRGPEAIIRYGSEKTQWAQEQFGEIIHETGLSPDAEREALREVMSRWKGSPQSKED